MLQIVEIIGRSEQGVTRPFLCRGDDGILYYVKGAGAGCKGLVAEWIAGNLGRHLNLPIPPISLAEVASPLLRHSVRDDLREIGNSAVFASRAVGFAEELRFDLVERIARTQQAWVLLFDCWIGNGDRTLSQHGGNPNILWTPHDSKMHLIDHNLAFEADPIPAIKRHHIFGGAHTEWTEAFRSDAIRQMDHAMSKLTQWWKLLPEDWLELAFLSFEEVQEMLWRFKRPGDILWA